MTGWLEPLKAIDAEGDPIAELSRYITHKLRMSRERPEASRLFANEVLHGATAIAKFLKGPLRELVDAKAAIIAGWMKAGKLNPVDPHHLIFAIWATTQHYADFDVQVRAVLGDGKDHMKVAEDSLLSLFIAGLQPR